MERAHALRSVVRTILVAFALPAAALLLGCTSSPPATTVPGVTAPGGSIAVPAVHSTNAPRLTTSTQSPPVAAAQSTATTQLPAGIIPDLVSADKTLDGVGGRVLPGTEIVAPVNVPPELQQQFMALHPGGQILYIGPHNRGAVTELAANEMNNCLVSVEGAAATQFLSFGGSGSGNEGAPGLFDRIAMEFKDLVLIPGSDDFYVHGVDPLVGDADIFVRVVGGADITSYPTLLFCLDLATTTGFEGEGGYYITGVLRNHDFTEFARPGDTLCIFTRKVSGVDERGCRLADSLGVIRMLGAKTVDALTEPDGAYLGLAVVTVTPELQKERGLSLPRGILVEDVDLSGPSLEAGIQVGDIMVTLDGTPVTRAEDLPVLLLRKQPGDHVTLAVDRAGKAVGVEVRLAAGPG